MVYSLVYLKPHLERLTSNPHFADYETSITRKSVRNKVIKAKNDEEALAKVEKFLARPTEVRGEWNKPIRLVRLKVIKYWKGNRVQS